MASARDQFEMDVDVIPVGSATRDYVGMIDVKACGDVGDDELDCGAWASFGRAEDMIAAISGHREIHFRRLVEVLRESHPADEVVALLDRFYIPPGHRVAGRAAALWEELAEAVRAQGAVALYALFGPDSDTDPRLLRSFMQMRGFVDTGLGAGYPILRCPMAAAAPAKEPSLWIDLRPSAADARRLAPSAEEAAADLHMTLTFHGKSSTLPPDAVARALRAVRAVAGRFAPVEATVAGAARFEGPAQDVVYAALRSPDVRRLRAALAKALAAEGLAPDATHAYVPHMTLGRVAHGAPWRRPAPPNLRLRFGAVRVWLGLEGRSVRLSG